jgi:LPPG:FO 2-phospho-L-lactate transferase
VVLLAGGTGGAKLARGMLDVLGPEELVVIANTGDDLEIYGGYVSPDPDLVTFWLADQIDERGWGLDGDTFRVMDGLRELGVEVWFNLGDRDLAIAVERARALRAGARLTEAHATIVGALGVKARVLPMSDQPVRTRVLAQGRWWPFQEFMIKGHAQGPVHGVAFRGASAARPTPEIVAALDAARAIVIGPSNPIISIDPILAVRGLRAAIEKADAPVVAVSPIVGGEVVKGPSAAFMQWKGQPLSATGVAGIYGGLIDGLVADEPVSTVPLLETNTLMDSHEARVRVAQETLRFAQTL